MVCDFPTRLQSEDVERARLFRTEVGEGRVGDVVSLQVELVELGEELRDCANAFIRNIDAVVDGHRNESRVQRRPQSLLRYFVAATDFQLIKSLKRSIVLSSCLQRFAFTLESLSLSLSKA